MAEPIAPALPVITTTFPSKIFLAFFILACSKDQYSTLKRSFSEINLYLDVSSTEEITLAFVSVRSPAILEAFRLLPTVNKPTF